MGDSLFFDRVLRALYNIFLWILNIMHAMMDVFCGKVQPGPS